MTSEHGEQSACSTATVCAAMNLDSRDQPTLDPDETVLSAGTTWGLALSMFVLGVFFLTLSPVLLDVSRDLAADDRALGYPGGAYSLALGLAALLMAPFQDALQRRWLLLVGTGLHASGVLVAASAPTWEAFILGHVLCGAGAGIFQPAAYALATDHTRQQDRARVFGRINAGWAASTLIGVPLASGFSDRLGWRLMILSILVVWCVVLLLIAPRLVTRQDQRAARRQISEVFSGEGLRSLVSARLHWLYAATVLIFVGFYGVYAFLGLAVRNFLDLGSTGAGAFVFFYGAGFLTGSLNTRFIDRVSPSRALFFSALVLGATLLAVPLNVGSANLLRALMYLWGVGQVTAFTSLTAVAGSVDASSRGIALSLKSASVMLGASLGTVTMGAINALYGYRAVGYSCAGATFIAAVIVRYRLYPTWSKPCPTPAAPSQEGHR